MALPSGRGPLIAYRSTTGTYTAIDTEAVTDDRERAVCRALLTHALKLLDEQDKAPKPPIGFA
ncbi:hypothetical protein ACIRQP_03540 [Streptomyces sp. NPDC102274]|uniref:hypothetical protein n=1 Tax=Streptomyces sp. NPDC102274 TaxID=3366151 RepID=UPI003814BE2D